MRVCNSFPRNIHSLLKKHVDLRKFSERQLSMFRKSLGFKLVYEGGWEGRVCVIPRSDRVPSKEFTKELYTEMCSKYFERIRAKFQRRLFCVKDRVGRTLAKNYMNDVRKLFVLSDDSSSILNEFLKSIEEAEIDNHFESLCSEALFYSTKRHSVTVFRGTYSCTHT